MGKFPANPDAVAQQMKPTFAVVDVIHDFEPNPILLQTDNPIDAANVVYTKLFPEKDNPFDDVDDPTEEPIISVPLLLDPNDTIETPFCTIFFDAMSAACAIVGKCTGSWNVIHIRDKALNRLHLNGTFNSPEDIVAVLTEILKLYETQ